MLTTGKHNNLVINGLDEKDDEDIKQIVLKLAEKIDVQLTSAFSAERMGKTWVVDKNRPILVKFSSHWDKRKLYFQRTKLASKGMGAPFLHEKG